MIGASIIKDLKELYDDYVKLILFIKDEIINNVRFSESSKTDITEMLLKSDFTITQITFDTGFKNSNYFSSTFKKNRWTFCHELPKIQDTKEISILLTFSIRFLGTAANFQNDNELDYRHCSMPCCFDKQKVLISSA